MAGKEKRLILASKCVVYRRATYPPKTETKTRNVRAGSSSHVSSVLESGSTQNKLYCRSFNGPASHPEEHSDKFSEEGGSKNSKNGLAWDQGGTEGERQEKRSRRRFRQDQQGFGGGDGRLWRHEDLEQLLQVGFNEHYSLVVFCWRKIVWYRYR